MEEKATLEHTEAAERHRKRPAVRFTLLLTSTLTVLAGAIISASLPVMEKHFADVPNSKVLVKLLLTLPALFIVLGAPIAGFIVDRFGRKPLLLIGLILYGIAGTAGYFLDSLTTLLVSRAILGIAVAGIMTCVTTLIADYYAGPERATVLGQQAAFMGLGGTVYTTLGGFLADFGWRNPFLIYTASFLILPFAALLLAEPPQSGVRFASAAGTGGAGGSSGSSAPPTTEPMPAGTLALIYSIVALMQIIFYLIPVQMPFYLQTDFGKSGTLIGLAIGLGTLSFAIGSLLSPRVAARVPRPSLIPLSFALIALGYTIVGFAPTYEIVIAGLVIGGQGFGYLLPQMAVWLTTIVPPALRGRALGGQTTSVFLGQFLSPILVQPVIAAQGYRGGYLAGALLLFFLAAVALVVARVRGHILPRAHSAASTPVGEPSQNG